MSPISATNLTGGTLSWSYRRNNYGTTRSYMEVTSRTAQYAVNGTVDNFTFTQDNNSTWHTLATVADQGAAAQKQWTFSGVSDYTAGLVQTYAEQDNHGNTTFSKTYGWAQSSSSKPYVATLTSTLSPGQNSASTTTTQQVDAYGNVTQQQVSDYSGSPTGTRTYNMTYTASNGNYAPLYIFNRLVTAAVSPGGTLSSNVYDGYCNGNGLTPTSATTNHDPNYTTSINYRGNPTSVSGLNGADPVCTAYDTAGVAYYSSDASGHSVSIQTSSSTNYSLPSAILPGGNSNLQTQATYASSWAPATLMGPNSAQGSTTYDSYGRPSQTTIPDGAVTTYTYTFYNSSTGANTQTATVTVDGRWQTTTLDGFGRTIQVQKGNGSTVASTVQTQYAPCACSPLGKISAVSQPYAPGATVYWTTYTYDASGRPLTVTAPDGHSTTTYTYVGNSTTVKDPATNTKTSTVDAYGNVIQVTEPNPAGGTFATYYTYTWANQLTGVSMTRGTVQQTRKFLYTGSDLTTATNPENGTVTYTYDLSHHVTSRTDALGQQTVYTYDTYGRLSEVQYFKANGGGEYTNQRVTYYYDNNYPSINIQTPSQQNSLGRLSAVAFGGGVTDAYDNSYYYMYGYNPAGRVTTQDMSVIGGSYNSYNNISFSATYQWDDEGRMTSLQYPTVTAYESFGNMPASMPTAGYQYDINGRLSEMTMNNGSGPQELASATYNADGQPHTLSWAPGTETRTYNSLGQLTGQSLPWYLNMTYNYSTTGQNNGRITGSVDGMTGESTSYTYDALNRLTAASNSLWSQSYTYDGFGNLLTKSLANGSPNPSPPLNVTYNANNQQNGLSYDANGNQGVQAGCGLYCGATYSVENRMVWQVEGGYPYPANVYAYDPWGKRVMSGYNPAPIVQGPSQPNYTYTFYGITGQRLATLNCNGSNYPAYPNCTITGQNVYYGKKLIVSGGVPVVTDRLGTVRADTQGEGFAYYPYGEERTATPDGRNKFATYFRDTVGQDYADQRYYGSATGRFWSPDRGRATRGNPTSWNRYAYVNGDPVNRFDPRGREDAAPGDGGCWSDDEGNFICSVDSTATPDGGGGGYYGVILNGDPTDDPTDDGDPDPPDPTPVPDPQQPTKNPSHPCTTGQRNFVSAHLADATAAAGLIGTSALDILALSGYESGWGTGPFIAAQGNYTGNAFFSLEGEIATPTSAPPATLYNSTGWSQPTSQTNADGMYAIMAGYASYYDAAMSFVNYKGGLFANVTDPTAFGKIASSNGYGISVSTFVSIANTLATCLH